MQKPVGQWSRHFNECQQCHRTDRPHMAGGLCRYCYLFNYNAANRPREKAYKRAWYAAHGGREWSRVQREERNYGGLREAALERDGRKCVRCGSDRLLTVHHRDGNGRGKPAPHNTLGNLETLCRGCHINIHREQLKAAWRAKGNHRPSGLTYKKKGIS